MSNRVEIDEACPHCDNEIGILWDVHEDGGYVHCLHCGERMHLCSMCSGGRCGEDNGKCFRPYEGGAEL